jgi:membrane-associated phospholipid phosphatase
MQRPNPERSMLSSARGLLVAVILLGGAPAVPVNAQSEHQSVTAAETETTIQAAVADGGTVDGSSTPRTPTPAVSDSRGETTTAGQPRASQFLGDVGADYKHLFARETAWWYGGGAVSAGLVHRGDAEIREEAVEERPNGVPTPLVGGELYGGPFVQYPMAIAWWTIGHVAGHAQAAETGRDLLRAQINATTVTYALKLVTNRTRPNGDPRALPSGHASASFATAMVLQQHYGWKVGIPFLAAATYTSASRIRADKHWASDVVLGAAIGMASGRVTTLHLRRHQYAVGVLAGARGGGVALTLVK